ncbi:MAG: hypothetical protein OEY75_12445 [Hylemonella sp.]|nr:hypothetical protein [Hylemonella sp.]MDH5709914.1 hypothetical protein [Hylemonella sp.]
MNTWLIAILVLIAAVGAAIFFVGLLVAVVTTAGLDKRWGFASMLLPPLAIVFCLRHPKQTRYALKLLAAGVALVLLAALPAPLFLGDTVRVGAPSQPMPASPPPASASAG